MLLSSSACVSSRFYSAGAHLCVDQEVGWKSLAVRTVGVADSRCGYESIHPTLCLEAVELIRSPIVTKVLRSPVMPAKPSIP
jgi:hypothetical protein